MTAATTTHARISSGRVIQLASGEAPSVGDWVAVPADAAPAIGWLYSAETGFSAPPAVAAPTVDPSRWVLPSAALDMLTAEEQLAAATAAQTRPEVLLWLIRLAAVRYVDLGDAVTKAGLDVLVGAGAITAARAADLLAGRPA